MTRPDAFAEQPVRLAAGELAVTVDVGRGARAVSWRYAQHELLARHGDDPVEYGMYPMAPWAGRVRGNVVDGPDGLVALPVTYAEWALHGTVLAAPMTVVEVDEAAGRLRASVPTPPWWPWPATVEVGWQVTPEEVVTELTVDAAVPGCPAVVGWHPWLRRRLDTGGPLAWSLAADAQVERGADHLPTGRLVPFDGQAAVYDDAFVVPGRQARLEWPGAVRIDVTNSADWYVVYDELPGVVCFEPQSGPPDGLRSASVRPAELAGPGSPVRLVTRWRVGPSAG